MAEERGVAGGGVGDEAADVGLAAQGGEQGVERRARCRLSNGAGAWRVIAKNSPIGRLKRAVSRSSVREASVSRALPPRMLSRDGVAGARTAATAPITAHTTSTTQRQRTSARANRSIRLRSCLPGVRPASKVAKC